MTKVYDLRLRTKEFSLRVIRLVEQMPRGIVADVIGRQLIKSSTSVGSNYRAACRARSKAEFEAKLQIVMEEADESIYWLEVIAALSLAPQDETLQLRQEADELTAIFVSGLKTSRADR